MVNIHNPLTCYSVGTSLAVIAK